MLLLVAVLLLVLVVVGLAPHPAADELLLPWVGVPQLCPLVLLLLVVVEGFVAVAAVAVPKLTGAAGAEVVDDEKSPALLALNG